MRASSAFETRFQSDNLRELYLGKIGVNSSAGLDKTNRVQFEKLLDSEIALIRKKAASCSYSFTSYRQILLSKGKGKPPREVCIPTIRDKLTLCALSQTLDDVFQDSALTPHPQKMIDQILGQANTHSFDSFAKFDISEFYSSIEHKTLIRIIRRKVRKKAVLHLIEDAIQTPSSTYNAKASCARTKGVPEGLPISNRLANLYLSDLDREFDNLKDCAYFRYVDDILVLCNKSDVPGIKRAIMKSLRSLGLSLNNEKCVSGELAKTSFSYLGYVFKPDGTLSVRKSSVLAIEQSLESLFRNRDKEASGERWKWKLNLRITGCRIKNSANGIERYGWLHYFSRITDIALLCHLDWLVEYCAV